MKNLLALLVVSCALAACESGPKLRANSDPAANFAQFRTYTFPEKTGTDRDGVSTPLTSYFKEAVRREMDARGYQFVESGDADLFVNFHANAKENVDVRSTPAPAVIAVSSSSGETRASSSTRRESFSSGISTRFTTKPGVSWQRIGLFPNRSPTAYAAPSTPRPATGSASR